MAAVNMEEILHARELRWQKRMELAGKCESLISVSLCIPMPYRGGERAKADLRDKCEQIQKLLTDRGFGLYGREELDGADGLTVYLMSEGGERLKRFCVEIEESLPNGRLLDIDITDKKPISRSDLGLPPRRCFICSGAAAECVAAQRHSREEIAAFIEGCGL